MIPQNHPLDSRKSLKIDMEVEDFTDELSDEALDRAEGAVHCGGSCSHGASVANR